MGKEDDCQHDLLEAAKGGDVPAIVKLVKEGVNVNCKNRYVSGVSFSFSVTVRSRLRSPPALFERLHHTTTDAHAGQRILGVSTNVMHGGCNAK